MAHSYPRPLRGLKPVPLKATSTLAVTLASALILAGCASSRGLAPEGHPLDADSLQTQRSLSGVAVSDAAFPRQDWWTTLGDAQLNALIGEALQGTRASTPPMRACARPSRRPAWPMRPASPRSVAARST